MNFTHKYVHTNGIRMHVVKPGKASQYCCATVFLSCGIPGDINSLHLPTPGFV